jgi:hypothetical protein
MSVTTGSSPAPENPAISVSDTVELSTQWLSDAEAAEWDEFVQAHEHGTLFHLHDWRTAIEAAFPHIRGRVLAVREVPTGRIVAGLAVFEVRSWMLGGRLVSVPFAPVVEPLTGDPQHLRPLLAALQQAVVDRGVWHYECRLREVPPRSVVPSERVQSGAKHHYLVLRQTGAHAGLHARVRKRIKELVRKSHRCGVVVRAGGTAEDWLKFYDLYARTRRRLGLPAMPRRFFENLATHLPERLDLSLAELDGHTVGALLGLHFNGLFLVEWVGDTPQGRAIGVNHRLYWEAIERATQLRCHTFSFGRTDTANHGLRDFKRRWGTIEQDIPSLFGTKAGLSPMTSPSGGRGRRLIAQSVLGYAPPWLYRRLSDFCYRHLG